MDYSKKIIQAVEKSGLSQKEFALKLGMDSANFNRILNKKQPFTLRTAVKFERAGFGSAEEWAFLAIKHLRNERII